ncbi:MAG: hypothetical protein JOZ60_00120 [Verrucomicrobia bacterium]|nr:hypothetical protein [Verrucomicrobiota bacterium]
MTHKISSPLALILLICELISFAAPLSALAHGFAGDRFFPATITTDDPFAASELSLPTVAEIRQPGSPPFKDIDISSDLSILIFPDTALTLSDGYQIQKAANQRALTGFDNAEANVLYEFFENDRHEAIASVGLTWEIGGTGRRALGADSFSTFTPIFYFGKGFGDLPEQFALMKPIAVTGEIGLSIPARAGNQSVSFDPVTGKSEITVSPNPDILEWGFALEYSLIYLQEHVKDIGLRSPFNRLIPLVEFSMESPVNRGGGFTTGTINPGVIWSGQYCQFGIEAMIPINDRTGHNVGVVAQMHFYLDDIFPKLFGKALFGN